MGRRSEFYIDFKILLEFGERAQQRVVVGHEQDVNVDR